MSVINYHCDLVTVGTVRLKLAALTGPTRTEPHARMISKELAIGNAKNTKSEYDYVLILSFKSCLL